MITRVVLDNHFVSHSQALSFNVSPEGFLITILVNAKTVSRPALPELFLHDNVIEFVRWHSRVNEFERRRMHIVQVRISGNGRRMSEHRPILLQQQQH